MYSVLFPTLIFTGYHVSIVTMNTSHGNIFKSSKKGNGLLSTAVEGSQANRKKKVLEVMITEGDNLWDRFCKK